MNRVLIVDDSPSVRQQVGMALTQAGFEVVEAVDGVDGAHKIGSDRRIGLVICDVNMPRMDGIEMLEAIRKEPANSLLPVLMLTTEGNHTLIERAKKAGAKGWIIKPFKPDLLVAAARKLLAP